MSAIDSVTAGRIRTSHQIFNLPFPRNRFFTGREDILKGIHASFNGGETVQALTGLGGIGKTQTALEFAYRYRQNYQVVLWGNAHSRETLVTDFVSMAGLLNLPEKNAQDQGQAVDAVKRWLENNTGWLLILDNADDLALAREFIPSGETGRVLLTTRAQYLGEVAARNAVKKMEPEEGALFLLRKKGTLKKDESLESAPSEIRNQAETLSKKLDGLPLALDQAAAFIGEMQTSIEGYLSLYETERAALLSHRGALTQGHPPVTVTFSLAFSKVADASPEAADLLRVCAFLEAESIPEEIFSEGGKELGEVLGSIAESPLKLARAIGEAGRFSLLQPNPEEKTLSLHRLVQEVLRSEMGEEIKRVWAERAVRAVNAVFPDVEFSNWKACSRLTPHAQALLASIKEYGIETEEAARILNQAGYYLRQRAQYVDAEPLFRNALEISERSFGPDHSKVGTHLNNLAQLLKDTNRLAEAEPLMRRSLEIDERSFGPEHPNVGIDLNNLALLLKDTNRLAEAEPLMRRQAEIFEKSLVPGHPYIAVSLRNYAGLLRAMNREEEAEELEALAAEKEDAV